MSSKFHFLLLISVLFSFLVFVLPGVKLSYGTAGFRADASILESTVFRVGILAALRSLKTRSIIGLMITASHNKVSDNGVKIADPSGGMLTQDWEPFADTMANAPTPQHLAQVNMMYTFVLLFHISMWVFFVCRFIMWIFISSLDLVDGLRPQYRFRDLQLVSKRNEMKNLIGDSCRDSFRLCWTKWNLIFDWS